MMKKVNVLFFAVICLLCSSLPFIACSNDEENLPESTQVEKYIDEDLVYLSGELVDYKSFVSFNEDIDEWMVYPTGIVLSNNDVALLVLPEGEYKDYDQKNVRLNGTYKYSHSLKYNHGVSRLSIKTESTLHIFKFTKTADIEISR